MYGNKSCRFVCACAFLSSFYQIQREMNVIYGNTCSQEAFLFEIFVNGMRERRRRTVKFFVIYLAIG